MNRPGLQRAPVTAYNSKIRAAGQAAWFV